MLKSASATPSMIMCEICCNAPNNSSRLMVACPFCNFEACRTCHQTYLLNEPISICMSCKKEWSREFLRKQFTAAFLNKPYRIHLEEVAFEQEKALMPETQLEVERIIKRAEIKVKLDEIDMQIRELKREKYFLQKKYDRGITQPENRTEAEDNQDQVPHALHKYSISRKCPMDECRGFLSTRWKCGVCNTQVCCHCHEIKDGDDENDEHTCDPDLVKTISLLKTDTKPCPKCSVSIHKIDGCDQMWCTQCHTAFSWKSGVIQTKIHNPHYYEWQRTHQGHVPREDEPIQACNPDINQHTINRLIDLWRNISSDYKYTYTPSTYKSLPHASSDFTTHINLFDGIIQSFIHNERVEWIHFEVNHVGKNREHRIKYMMNKITETQFKTAVQRTNKKSERNREMNQVFQFATICFQNIINRFIYDLGLIAQENESKDIRQTHAMPLCIDAKQEIDELMKTCNNMLFTIHIVYNCSHYHFNSDNYYRFINKTAAEANALRSAKK